MHYQPSPIASQQISEVPIVMVALPYENATDATLYSLRQAAARSLGLRPGARLACVTVIPEGLSSTSDEARSETSVHRRYLAWLHHWAQALPIKVAMAAPCTVILVKQALPFAHLGAMAALDAGEAQD
jgi:hypothetical protein